MKENILIPKPNSAFLNIQCSKCGANIIIYSHTTSNISCKSCNELIAERTGGKAKINGNIISTLD
ncbi:MAG TPA: 30S ribosomal protein S27e [Nitrososphaeraceae archaeon]|nr:30S ribosomal protein S27e [Nitrososphaeraceae archaeon]